MATNDITTGSRVSFDSATGRRYGFVESIDEYGMTTIVFGNSVDDPERNTWPYPEHVGLLTLVDGAGEPTVVTTRYVVVRSDLHTLQIDVLGAGMTFSTPELAAEFAAWQSHLPGCELSVCKLTPAGGVVD